MRAMDPSEAGGAGHAAALRSLSFRASLVWVAHYLGIRQPIRQVNFGDLSPCIYDNFWVESVNLA